MELPEFIDFSQNLTVWSCDKSLPCAVFCEAKRINGRILKHSSVFCVHFCANGAQNKVVLVFRKTIILQNFKYMKNYKTFSLIINRVISLRKVK